MKYFFSLLFILSMTSTTIAITSQDNTFLDLVVTSKDFTFQKWTPDEKRFLYNSSEEGLSEELSSMSDQRSPYVDFGKNVTTTLKKHSLYQEYTEYARVQIPEYGADYSFFENILGEKRMNCLLPFYHPDSSYVVDATFYIHGARKRAENTECISKEWREVAAHVDYEKENTQEAYRKYMTRNEFFYVIESDRDQTIPIRIFPVTDKEYVSYQRVDRRNLPLFTLIDPTYDIVQPSMKNNMLAKNAVSFEKKYMVTQFDSRAYSLPYTPSSYDGTLTYFPNKSDGSPQIFHTIVPYYETTLELKKGKNLVYVSYMGYAPEKGYMSN